MDNGKFIGRDGTNNPNALLVEGRSAVKKLRGLTVYRGILGDPLFQRFADIFNQTGGNGEPLDILDDYYSLMGSLLERVELRSEPIVGDPWQDYILDYILGDSNCFSLKAERAPMAEMGRYMLSAVERDMLLLQAVCGFSLDKLHWALIGCLEKCSNVIPRYSPAANAFKPFAGYPFGALHERTVGAKRKLIAADRWDREVAALASFYRENGTGIFARNFSFRWLKHQGLVGAVRPDLIKLCDLIAYEHQRQKIVANTRQFLQGFPANNVLLYGDRGTGKSSTIKALVNEFAGEGLRLVQVGRECLEDLPNVLTHLQGSSRRFIIFIDDLSFEEYETEFKHLKALLEGSVEMQPENVLVYATSNRRHLVKETFSEGSGATGSEIHPEDSSQEKLSLADRFGLVVTFVSPDRDTYLDIVKGIAAGEGIQIDPEELTSLALRWELAHNGRSGRTARQFIHDLVGRMRSAGVEYGDEH